jgi:hypothetical protein
MGLSLRRCNDGGSEEMSDEQLARAEMLRAAIEDDRPKPRLETRVEWLEADGSAQRTAIIRLERAMKITCKALWCVWVLCVALAVGR